MMQRQMEAWKKFLHGRIAQEEGREEEGLGAIEQALEIDPDNRHFLNARVIARGNMGRNLSRSEEDLLAHVEQSYEQLAGALASEKAEPQRVNRLKAILAELEGRPICGHERTYIRGLHC
jgi:tetratricopeptide (TPR) repeat protein